MLSVSRLFAPKKQKEHSLLKMLPTKLMKICLNSSRSQRYPINYTKKISKPHLDTVKHSKFPPSNTKTATIILKGSRSKLSLSTGTRRRTKLFKKLLTKFQKNVSRPSRKPFWKNAPSRSNTDSFVRKNDVGSERFSSRSKHKSKRQVQRRKDTRP